MYNPEPLGIIQVNGSQILMRDANGNTYRRNFSHVKQYREDPNLPIAPKPDEEEFETDAPSTGNLADLPNIGHPVHADTPPAIAMPVPENSPRDSPSIPVRTSGRDKRPPNYLEDYIRT